MSGISLGLTRISTLLSALHSPHLATPIIHIAGTNGKGSVAAYLSSILLASSIKVGRFNSPHLVDEWDCLQLNGQTVDRRLFDEAKLAVNLANEKDKIGATSFEVLTATAFEIFRRAEPKLDVAIVEVGMGGRTDATNVVGPEGTVLSVVTSIELDHQKFLGDTVEEIARVKGGIVKRGADVVLAKQGHKEVEDVMESIADEMDARVHFAGEGVVDSTTSSSTSTTDSSRVPTNPLVSLPLSAIRTYPSTLAPNTTPPLSLHLPLPGSYQLANAAASSLAAHVLRTSPRALSLLPLLSNITNSSIEAGIESTTWPGRLDWLSFPPTPSSQPSGGQPKRVLVDGAHNPSSASHLSSYLHSLPPNQSLKTLIIALSFPRSPSSILTPLLAPSPSARSTITKIICVPFTLPPSMEWIKPTATGDIATAARGMKGIEEVVEMRNVEEAIDSLGAGETAVVAGSLYLAADVYRLARRGGNVEA